MRRRPGTTISSRRSFRDRELITVPSYAGAAFGTADDGDLTDDAVRAGVADSLGITVSWAWMHQVHGTDVLDVDRPGPAGEGDALLTSQPALPIAVRTADCVPVVIHGESAVAVVHAGWRGMAGGVVTQTLEAMEKKQATPVRAAIGPSIGPCCFEVGDEVVAAFGGRANLTSWGTPSVDLWTEAERQLAGLDVWRADLCTRCEAHFHSYRGGAGSLRQVTVGWL